MLTTRPPLITPRDDGPQGTVPSPYVEFPMDPIVDIHWKKKEPPDGDCPPTDKGCNVTYTYTKPSDTSSDNPAPFFGSFVMNGWNGPPIPEYSQDSGTWGHSNIYWPGINDMVAQDGQVATFLNVDHTSLNFTTDQLDRLPPGFTYRWYVLMAVGQERIEIPVIGCYNDAQIVDTYEFTFDGPSDTIVPFLGISISHPRDDGGVMTVPVNPMYLGSVVTFTYKVHFGRWFFRNSGIGGGAPINGSNEHDPEMGGPLYIWWYGPNGPAKVSANLWSVKPTCFGLRDNYIEDGIIPANMSDDEYISEYLIPYNLMMEQERERWAGRVRRVPTRTRQLRG